MPDIDESANVACDDGPCTVNKSQNSCIWISPSGSCPDSDPFGYSTLGYKCCLKKESATYNCSGGGGDDSGCCRANCSPGNREGSCTRGNGQPGYNCPAQCDDDGESDPPPRACDFTYKVECKKTCPGVNIVGECGENKNGVTLVKCKVRSSSQVCKSPQDCSPARCPAGTSEDSVGGTRPLVTTKKCTATSAGACGSDGKCLTTVKERKCYATLTPPPIIVTDPIVDHEGTTVLGCTTSGSTGQEINNAIDIKFDLSDSDGASDIRAFMLWFGTDLVPPDINQIAESGTPLLENNNSYGFMVGYIGGTWKVFAPQYNSSSGTWLWVLLNPIGSGEIGRIKGAGGKDLAIINDIGVSDIDANIKRMTAQLEILHEGSGVADYESPAAENYKVFAAGMDDSRWVQSGTVMSSVPSYQYVQDWTVDMFGPTREDISHSVVTADRFNLNWDFDDISSVLRVVGDAQEVEGGEGNGPIDGITSGVTSYELGSGDTGTNFFGGYHLFSYDSTETGTDLIDIRDNEGGALDFVVTAFDNACNAGEYTYNLELGEPWIITKGGIVYSAGGTSVSVKSFIDHEPFSADPYWTGMYGFFKDEVDLSTEILAGGGSGLNALINNVKLSSVRATGYSDRNNRSSYWFDELSRRYESRLALDPSRYTDVNILSSTELSGKSSDIIDPVDSSKQCNGSTACIVKVSGDLTLNEGYSCDTRTTFLVDGDVTVSPNLSAASTPAGCMFVASGDITIDAGQYQSSGSTYPKYDVVEGFFIADGQINIPEVDQSQDVRDGLIVHGSLVAFGGSGSQSVSMGRTLKLIDNNAYPSLAVHFDSRYFNFATTVFGGDTEAFKREVGFKPL